MPTEIQDTVDGETSVENLLATVDHFLEGVYRNFNVTPPVTRTSENSNRLQSGSSNDSSPDISPVGARSLSVSSSSVESENITSPSLRMKMDVEIERINRMCDTVDKNLRSIGVFMNSFDSSSSEDHPNINISCSPFTSTNSMQRTSVLSPVEEIPDEVIDLSETPLLSHHLDNSNNNYNEDDDVILVSANINPVVDLCTPGGAKDISRQRRRHSNLSRQRLLLPEVEIVNTCDFEDQPTPSKRRTESKSKSLHVNTSVTEVENHKNANDRASTSNNLVSGTIPYMCAVCMESCLARQPTSTRCGHIFCNACIKQAIFITHKCPMCNRKTARHHLFRIYP